MNDENLEYTEGAENLPEATVPANKPRDYVLPNRAYDVLKPVTTTYLPGVITLWLTLVTIWNWGYGEQVALTLGAINVFLGLLVQAATRSYNHSEAKYDGVVQLLPGEYEHTLGARVRLDDDAEQMLGKKQVLLHVDNTLPK